MKTVEQLIFEKRFKDAEFDPNDYNDWAKENEYEAYTLCLAVAKQLQQHLVMQAEASASVKGAAVASEGEEKCVCGGFDEGYKRGYQDATSEAIEEIHKNYKPRA